MRLHHFTVLGRHTMYEQSFSSYILQLQWRWPKFYVSNRYIGVISLHISLKKINRIQNYFKTGKGLSCQNTIGAYTCECTSPFAKWVLNFSLFVLFGIINLKYNAYIVFCKSYWSKTNLACYGCPGGFKANYYLSADLQTSAALYNPYTCLFEQSSSRTQSAALSYCTSQAPGSYLLTVRNSVEYQYAKLIITDFGGSSNKGIWTNAYYAGATHVFKWAIDGTTLPLGSANYWCPPQPNGYIKKNTFFLILNDVYIKHFY